MRLTEGQKESLAGGRGEIEARLMRLLVRLGEIYGAEDMVEIESAQVAGVSYKSLGAPGLEFVEDIARQGARVRVLTSLNPAGVDLENWRELGFPEEFVRKQERILRAYAQMGIAPSITCTPYLVGNLPRFGSHIAWAESSAVSFANSVIGARTNREGGPSALAAAVCGCTPRYGLHLPENRRAQVLVEVECELLHNSDFAALGCGIGKRIQNKIPYFRGIRSADTDQLKSLGAAMAASGAVALYHVEGITPEAGWQDVSGLEEIRAGAETIEKFYATPDGALKPDLIVAGCPHASLREIIALAKQAEGRKSDTPFWVCTSRAMKRTADQMGLTEVIEAAGGKIVADTCMVVSPIEDMGFPCIGTDSGKAAQYLPGFCKKKVAFRKTGELLQDPDERSS